jgi:hypothetical protein
VPAFADVPAAVEIGEVADDVCPAAAGNGAGGGSITGAGTPPSAAIARSSLGRWPSRTAPIAQRHLSTQGASNGGGSAQVDAGASRGDGACVRYPATGAAAAEHGGGAEVDTHMTGENPATVGDATEECSGVHEDAAMRCGDGAGVYYPAAGAAAAEHRYGGKVKADIVLGGKRAAIRDVAGESRDMVEEMSLLAAVMMPLLVRPPAEPPLPKTVT